MVGARSGADPDVEACQVMLSAEAATALRHRIQQPPRISKEGPCCADFSQHYLSYTPDSVTRNFAESLNMMTANLRKLTMDKLRDDDTHWEDHSRIRSFRTSEFDRSNAPKTPRGAYVVFGVKEVHHIKNGTEVTDRIVGQYNLRLVEERRTRVEPEWPAGGRLFRATDGGGTRQ